MGRSADTRRADGKPETDADRRFFDLRESGYQGWINQDGNAVNDKRRERQRRPAARDDQVTS